MHCNGYKYKSKIYVRDKICFDLKNARKQNNLVLRQINVEILQKHKLKINKSNKSESMYIKNNQGAKIKKTSCSINLK